MSSTLVTISMFPIPGMVALPNAVIPLQLFEPRFLQMFEESTRAERRIGVTHFIEGKGPENIFSAGFAQLVEKLPDDRLIIQIENDGRYRRVRTIQEEPYLIVECEPYQDQDTPDFEETPESLRQELNSMLRNLPVPNVQKLREYLQSVAWTTQSHHDFSFSIFDLVRFDPDTVQKIIELRSPAERMSFLRDALLHPLSN